MRNCGDTGRNGKGIGFLKTSNRINVLLSRAMHGMYLMGQSSLLEKHSTMWKQVLAIINKSPGAISDCFSLQCQKHADTTNRVNTPQALKLVSPDGGCLLPCQMTLRECGHRCPRLCHSDLPEHFGIFCSKPCDRLHRVCQHSCPKLCGQDCGECAVDVGDVTLACGHIIQNTPCHLARNHADHQCKKMVEKVVPVCGHPQKMACCIVEIDFDCRKICGMPLSCGHACRAACSKCVTLTMTERGITSKLDKLESVTKHADCQSKCGRQLSCGHACEKKCHDGTNCGPCKRPCDRRVCNHSKCSHLCSLTCEACAETCEWECLHQGKCLMPCGAPCSRIPCDLRCEKLLACGHQCPSVCGEICPNIKYCQICATDAIKDTEVDLIMFETYRNIELDETPVIFLKCGHFKTVESLDGMLELSAAYTRDQNGWDAGRLPSLKGMLFKTPVCADCRAPIKNIRRYGRIVKKAMLDNCEKSFILRYDAMLNKLLGAFENTTSPQGLNELAKQTIVFKNAAYLSPSRKIYDRCVAQLRRNVADPKELLDRLDIPTPASRFIGEAGILLARIYTSQLDATSKDSVAGAKKKTLQELKGKCKEIIKACNEAVAVLWAGSNTPSMLMARFVRAQSTVKRLKIAKDLNFAVLLEATKETKPCKEETKIEANIKVMVAHANAVLLDDMVLLQGSAMIMDKYKAQIKELKAWLECFVDDPRSNIPLNTSELLLVYQAMAQELRGTGHWYRCPNGHSYVIGNCGMANQESRCPECGAAIGGSNYTILAGNTHATGFEQEMQSALRRSHD